jgi:hypothetical protein
MSEQLLVTAASPPPHRPGERNPGTHWIGGCVDHRIKLDNVEKRKILPLPGFEVQPLGLNSQSLYRLSYLGSDMLMLSRVVVVA